MVLSVATDLTHAISCVYQAGLSFSDPERRLMDPGKPTSRALVVLLFEIGVAMAYGLRHWLRFLLRVHARVRV